MKIGDRLAHAWNAFMNRDPTTSNIYSGSSYFNRPDRTRLRTGTEKSIINAIYNRLSLDTASMDIRHVRLDDNGRYIETIDSYFNECLTLSANTDQTSRMFMQDVAMSLLDEGSVAIVPVDTTFNPNITSSYDILSLRTGKILEWFPQHVKIRVYDENKGVKKDVIIPKKNVALIENPYYSIMNAHNSTLQRLIRKLNILDAIDEQSGSGKLDMIIKLPYAIKGTTRQRQAEERRKKIEDQLTDSKYGIAYIDGTESITQLNRPVENNLMKQIEYLTNLLFSQLGLTQAILDGTADEKTMLNYYNRTIEPLLSAITDEMKRKFLTKTARTQGQTIQFFRDPFKLVPVTEIAEIADTLTRNEIASSNEIRQIMGWKPSSDPKADELRNSNISAPNDESEYNEGYSEYDEYDDSEDSQEYYEE